MNWWEFGGFASLGGFVSLVVNVSLVSLYELATGGSADLTGVLVGAFLTVFFAMIFAVYPLWCLLAALVVGPGPAPSRLAAAREATGRA